jgi:protoporphyrinogen oxidase
MQIEEIVVVGTGISGLSIANLLIEKGHTVKLVEKKSEIGGLIRCTRVDGSLFHTVGGHVFNSKNPKVLDWFWAKFDRDKEFIQATRNAKILLNGKFVGYPLEDYLYQLTDDKLVPILDELIKKIESNKYRESYNSFKDFLIDRFGENLYNLYFGPYNTKIWKRDLSTIPIGWLDGKLPMPNIYSILRNNIMRVEESTMVHSKFWYPRYNGSQFIVDRLSRNLDIITNTELNSIRVLEGGLILNDKLRCNKLIFTGDVRCLNDILEVDDIALNKVLREASFLSSNGTSNVFCETDDIPLSWLYIPEPHFLAHRIIYTGNFSLTNNSPQSRKTCVVEFSGMCSEELMLADLTKLPGNLKPISINYEPSSYVVQDLSTRDIISKLKTHLKKYNIHLLGRFAEWEYYNMDVCIEKAIDLCTQI